MHLLSRQIIHYLFHILSAVLGTWLALSVIIYGYASKEVLKNIFLMLNINDNWNIMGKDCGKNFTGECFSYLFAIQIENHEYLEKKEKAAVKF